MAALGVLFCLLGGGFFLAGPKAALFVSGFGTLPLSERARYDTAALSRDYARRFLGWGVLLLAGPEPPGSLERMGCAAGIGSLAGAVLGGRCTGTPSGHLNDMI